MEAENAGSRGFVWERPGLICDVRETRVGGTLQFRGSFLEGGWISDGQANIPCQEQTAVEFPFKEVKP